MIDMPYYRWLFSGSKIGDLPTQLKDPKTYFVVQVTLIFTIPLLLPIPL